MTLDDGMKECKFILYIGTSVNIIIPQVSLLWSRSPVGVLHYRSFVGGKWHKLSMGMCYIGNHSQW